ncbi:NAD(P)H-binding protein [Nocardia sp. NPDC058058]|uniref:NAD(P)H-binding protein n=1 Tax=Nocardia sp. NPDC058058 TaxID=3346317 RepID=UPI0036DC148C
MIIEVSEKASAGVILVIGATGKVGRQVMDRLMSLGTHPLRALVRSREQAKLPASVDIVEGSLTDQAALAAALVDVDTVLLMWPFLTLDDASAVLDSIEQRARRIVYLSSVGVGSAEELDDPIFAMHAAMERLIARTSLTPTILRSDTIASNTLGWAEQIRATGVVRGPLTAPTAVVDPRDLAAVAATVLTDDAHAGRTYLLTGPRVISRPDQVDAIAAALGRPLRFEEVAVDDARRQLLDDGRPPALVDALLAAAEKRSRSTLLTSTVEDLTGRPASSFEQWATDHAAAFR